MASTESKGRSRTAPQSTGQQGAQGSAPKGAQGADRTQPMQPVTGRSSASRQKGSRSAADRAQEAKDAIAAKVGRRSSSRSAPRERASMRREEETVVDGVRRVRLTLASVDPFSVMKLSFLIALAVGIAIVVAVAVLWNIIDTIGLWDQMDELARSMNDGEPLPFMEYFEFSKFFSYGVIVAVLHVIILTALGTLLSFLYNIVARLLGGLRMTFTDE